jgi:hypothetical protein
VGLRKAIGDVAFKAALSVMQKTVSDRMTDTQLVQFLFGQSTSLPRPGTGALLGMYSTSPWLRAVTQRTSWAVSAVPWTLSVVTSKEPDKRGKAVRHRMLARCMDPQTRVKMYKSLRRDDSLRELTDHPALALMDDGNSKFAGQTVRSITQQHLDLVGETFWIMDRNGLGLPSAIWPAPPTWCATRPLEGLNPSPYNPKYYVFTSPTGSREVLAEDVIRFYHPDPQDPYNRASGIGHVLGDELETDEFAAKYTKRWFKNNAIPPMIVSLKDTKKDNVERYEDAWMKKLSGRPNVPFFTNREVTVEQLNQTFQQMELTQLRKDERDAIIHVFGAPPEIFGIIENSNRSTIDAADYLFAKYVVVPRLEFLRITLQKHLIERYDDRLILDYVSPIVEDKEFNLKVVQAASAAFEVDYIRELGGAGPDKQGAGQGRLVPLGTTWVPSLTELAPPEESEPTDRPAPVLEGDDADDE